MINNFINLIKSYKLSAANLDYSYFTDFEIGCSFDPMHQIFFETSLDPMDVLKYLYDELKIRNIRLAVRWSKVFNNGDLNFEFYKPYFDYCFSNNLKVVLNVGPIKSMRWPEEHVPVEFMNLVNAGDNITLDHPIATNAIQYLELLLKFIKKEYNNSLNNIIAIQGDNEGFNRFGEYGFLITQEFERKILKLIKQYFPDKPLFINSAGLNDIPSIFNLIKEIDSEFIIGINYYYKVKYQHRIPLINKLDNITINSFRTISPEKLKKEIQQRSLTLEVSELQGEPWWPNALSPGNNFREFLFTLLRTKYLKPEGQNSMLVRYWGIEDFVAKFLFKTETLENKKIKDLIIGINSKND